MNIILKLFLFVVICNVWAFSNIIHQGIITEPMSCENPKNLSVVRVYEKKVNVGSVFWRKWENKNFVSVQYTCFENTYSWDKRYDNSMTDISSVENFFRTWLINYYTENKRAFDLQRGIIVAQWDEAVQFSAQYNCLVSEWDKLSVYSGCLPRPVLFVHGVASSMGFWSLNRDGDDVLQYKENSIPNFLSARYGLDVLNKTQDNIDPKVTEDVEYALNNNGLEFFNGDGELLLTEVFAQLLHAKFEDVLNKYYPNEAWKTNPDLMVDIVAHSQGGLAVRQMIADYRSNNLNNPINHIRTVITLNSPHLGTSLASTNSEYESLNKFLKLATGEDKLTIHGNADWGFSTMSMSNDNSKEDKPHDSELFGGYWFQLSDQDNIKIRDLYEMGDQIRELMIAGKWLFAMNEPNSIEALKAVGFPTHPITSKEIPFTAFYSKAPANFMTGLIQNGFASVKEDGVRIMSKYLAGEEAHEIFNEMYADVEGYVTDLDKEWTPVSDGVVDVFSQKLQGHFSPVNQPFSAIELIPHPGHAGILHGGKNIGGFQFDGPEFHAQEVYDALISLPGKIYQYALELEPKTMLNTDEDKCSPVPDVQAKNGTIMRCLGSGSSVSFQVIGKSEIIFDWKLEGLYGAQGQMELYVDGEKVVSSNSVLLETASYVLSGGIHTIEFRISGGMPYGHIGPIVYGYIDNVRLNHNIVPTIITPLLLN